MKKSLIMIASLLALLMLVGCSSNTTVGTTKGKNTSTIPTVSLDAPTNIKVAKGIITFDEVTGATSYQLKVYQDGQFLMNLTVNSGDDISSYFEDGEYLGKLYSKNGTKSSAASEDIQFFIGLHAVDVTTLNEISDIDLQLADYINWSGRTYFNNSNKRMYFYYQNIKW